jgi:DNA-binding NarL/FixJ family response regulator
MGYGRIPDVPRRRRGKIVNVVVADTEARVCSALWLLLEQQLGPRVCEVSEACNRQSSISSAQRLRPLLILLDWQLVGKETPRLLRTLHQVSPGVQVVAIGVLAQDRRAAPTAGAQAFASKRDPPDELISTIAAM